ncbi:MAG: isocitrate lyase/phosphoenolpyruvate mutase family protein [Pseudomonadota bacterium]
MTFRDLHRPGDPFVLVNVWDLGTARMAAALGAQALATSSAAHAFTMGRGDGGTITRDEALAHAQEIVAATDLPVNGDFENGFGDDPDTCAETVRLAAEAGLAGIGIEDTNLAESTHYPFDLTVERIRAAAASARALSGDFVLTARADGVMEGTYGITEAIARIKAFAEAGADCLYVPMPETADDLRTILGATDVPVNVLASGPWAATTRDAFADLGAARISLGAALSRAGLQTIHDALRAMLDGGDFSPLGRALPGDEVERVLG